MSPEGAASRSAAHTRDGDIGKSSAPTPRVPRASRIALTAEGRAPATPDSPAPFTPRGLVVQGTPWWPTRSAGRSPARGIM